MWAVSTPQTPKKTSRNFRHAAVWKIRSAGKPQPKTQGWSLFPNLENVHQWFKHFICLLSESQSFKVPTFRIIKFGDFKFRDFKPFGTHILKFPRLEILRFSKTKKIGGFLVCFKGLLHKIRRGVKVMTLGRNPWISKKKQLVSKKYWKPFPRIN